MPNNDQIVRGFVDCFEGKDASRLEPFLDTEVVFCNYGDDQVDGRSAVLATWTTVFEQFDVVRFETVHQAVNGDIVLAEQIHHLGFPGAGRVAPIMNVAVYELRGGLITAWRDYTNPVHARTLLTG